MTLAEVMVVVVVIGILSGLAAPSFLRILRESQLDGDANALFHDIQWARIQARKTGNPMRIEFADTNVLGRSTKRWALFRMVPGGSAPVTWTKTPIRANAFGISVQLGLPAAVSEPSSAAFDVFSGLSGSGGLLGSASTTCTEGTAETWADGIQFCGGSSSDMENGGLYLMSDRSDARAHAIAFNRAKSLVPKRFRHIGGSWEAQ